jgi:hypothetical protein
VQINDYLWARVEFSDWDTGLVRSYTLYANGLSPNRELVNEAIGIEWCEGAPYINLPSCIATPLLMFKVRGRSTKDTKRIDEHLVWMNNLQVTVEDVFSITRRDKWEYYPHGEKLCKELISILCPQEHTKDSELPM